MAAIGVACSLGACSLFTELDGLTSGARAVADGGGGPDSGPDSAPIGNDGGPTADADSGNDGGASTLSLCEAEANHFFCMDFDRLALSQEFDDHAGGAGSVTRDTTRAFSLPGSLGMGRPEGSPSATPFARKARSVAAMAGLSCKFRYRRDQAGGGVVVLLIVEMKTATERLFAEIKDGPSQGRLYLETTAPDGGTASDFPIIPTVSAPSPAWANVEWTLDLAAAQSVLRRDGAKIDSRNLPASIAGKNVMVTMTLGLGNFQAPTSSWQVNVDDFVCDTM